MIDFLLPPENERQSCLAGPADRDEWHHKKRGVIKKFNPYNKKEDQES